MRLQGLGGRAVHGQGHEGVHPFGTASATGNITSACPALPKRPEAKSPHAWQAVTSGRPAVYSGRLAEVALMGLTGLDADLQIPALCAEDGRAY